MNHFQSTKKCAKWLLILATSGAFGGAFVGCVLPVEHEGKIRVVDSYGKEFYANDTPGNRTLSDEKGFHYYECNERLEHTGIGAASGAFWLGVIPAILCAWFFFLHILFQITHTIANATKRD